MTARNRKKKSRLRRKHTFPSRVFMTTSRVKMARFDFVTKARLTLTRFDWSELRDNLELLLKLAWIVFLYGFFVCAPLTIGKIYGPGWGVLVALLGFPIWGIVGVAPRPGCFSFLEWFLCITGYIMIVLSVTGATLKLLIPLIWR